MAIATWGAAVVVPVLTYVFTRSASTRNEAGEQPSAERELHDAAASGARVYIAHLEDRIKELDDRNRDLIDEHAENLVDANKRLTALVRTLRRQLRECRARCRDIQARLAAERGPRSLRE